MLVDVRRVRFWLFSVLLAFVVCAPGRAADGGFDFFWPDRIVVFGTSLSDPGNAFALSDRHLVPPYVGPGINPLTLIPESEWPYAIGGKPLQQRGDLDRAIRQIDGPFPKREAGLRCIG